MTEGDLAVRTRLEGQDELAELGHALDRLAGSLAATLGQLRAERDLQGRILEAMQEGVVVVDRDGRIVLVNPALRAMLLSGRRPWASCSSRRCVTPQLDDLLEDAREPHDAKPGRDRAARAQAAAAARARLASVGRRRGAALRLRRRDGAAAPRVAPSRLRRQRVARASHADRGRALGDRDAALGRARRSRRPPSASSTSSSATRSACRASSRTCWTCRSSSRNEFKLKRERVELGSVVPIVLALFRERAEKKGVRLAARADPAARRRSKATRGRSSTCCRTWSTTP